MTQRAGLNSMNSMFRINMLIFKQAFPKSK